MQHVSLEDLARLVEESPTEEEALHLAGCEECREELEAMRAQTAGLRSLPALSAPAGGWPRLEAGLRAEGLIPPRAGSRWRWSGVLRIAAALALFVSGGLTGAILWGPRAGGAAVALGESVSVPEAEQVLREREAAYLQALARYAELTGANQAADPLSRLAALEGIVLTTRAALEEAPADPVINGYHLAALGQREAMLRQISREGGDEWF